MSHGEFPMKITTLLPARLVHVHGCLAEGDMIPKSALEILKCTLDTVRVRANTNGECFGGEIADAMRDAGVALGVDRLEVLLTRTLLLRAMESLGETYPAALLQDFETRMPVSRALAYLSEAVVRTANTEDSGEATRVSTESR
jgi:hypothetical protein